MKPDEEAIASLVEVLFEAKGAPKVKPDEEAIAPLVEVLFEAKGAPKVKHVPVKGTAGALAPNANDDEEGTAAVAAAGALAPKATEGAATAAVVPVPAPKTKPELPMVPTTGALPVKVE